MGGRRGQTQVSEPVYKGWFFLGVLFDTEKLTEVSRERVDECMNMLDEWLGQAGGQEKRD